MGSERFRQVKEIVEKDTASTPVGGIMYCEECKKMVKASSMWIIFDEVSIEFQVLGVCGHKRMLAAMDMVAFGRDIKKRKEEK